jgi:hypothetical protein
MLPDLEHLIHLQRLDDATARARQAVADLPARLAELEARLADQEQALAAARARLDENQKARRELEKQVAAVQGRLSRYKDQLMEVKTNKEYQAMQHEIAAAEREVRSTEDRILDRMEEGEAITREMKAAEAALASERATVNAETHEIERQRAAMEDQIARAAGERQAIVAGISPEALAIFESISPKRNGVAVVEARDGHCSVCNVRLRPQRFLEVRRNDTIIQCDSCQRILYFVAPAGGETPPPAEA